MCMNILGENDKENELIKSLNVGVDQHRTDGREERHINKITESNYHDIADLAIPGVPETYEAFITQVKLNMAEPKRLRTELREGRPAEDPSENTIYKPMGM